MFQSMTSWLGGAIAPDSPEQEKKIVDATKDVSEEKKDESDAAGSEATTPVNEDVDPAQMMEDVSAKAYTAAKAWGTYLFSVSKVATKTVAKTAMQLKDKVEENTPLISDFSKEQKKFREENQEVKRQREAAVPPWIGYHEEEAMKEQILALSLDRRNFLRNPPAGVPFHFDFTNFHPVAIATLQEDPNLAKMRFELVPKMTSEENFWKNYFYRVSLIKQSTQLTTLAQQTGSTGECDVRRGAEESEHKVSGGDSSSSGSDYDKLSDINELARDAAESLNHGSPLGVSPPENEFVSDAFQSTVNEDDLRKEMEQMRITNNQLQTEHKSSPTEEDIPEWERELQQELSEYDMMDSENVDDVDIESEILKQLEAETEAELQQQ